MDRPQTVAQMGKFAKGGTKPTSLQFPRNARQRYGDVVILYTSFRLVLTDSGRKASETTGRGTEVFVRRRGRWVHTAWHLDNIGNWRSSARRAFGFR